MRSLLKSHSKWLHVFVVNLALAFFAVSLPAATFVDCDFDTAPSSESEGGTYACSVGSMSLEFRSNLSGPVFDHVTTAGWNNSGAAKFYTHVAAQSWGNSYRWLIPSAYTSEAQQNLRYLIKLEPGAASQLSGKWHLADAAGGWRTWYAIADRGCGIGGYHPEVAFNNTSYVVHGGGASSDLGCGYQLCENPATWWDRSLSSCRVVERNKFNYQGYEDQWVAVELERHRDGAYKIYIWTRDGAFHGLYYELDTTMSQSLGAAPVGAYLESGSATGRYFLIDEVKISDSFIGPPEGFVTASTPRPPQDVTVD